MLNDTPGNPATNPCLLCPPPKQGSRLRPADAGYKTCTGCYDRIRDTLRGIVERYAMLDAAPSSSGDGGRGAPGFGSRSPASDHIIAMTDRRSSAVARTWQGADGRLYREPERPPLSVVNVLETIGWDIAEHRGVEGPKPALTAAELAWFIDVNLDWATRQDLIVDVWQMLRDLLGQLRPATGDRRSRIGTCPNTIDETECGATLHAPTRGDSIQCTACGRTWHRPEWMELGRLLQATA